MHERGGCLPSALLLALMLAGCAGSGSQEPRQATTTTATSPSPAATTPDPNPTAEYPAHALVLRDTIPRSYSHRRFIAFNITKTSGHLDVVGRDGRATSLVVSKGQRFTADGATFRVLDVIPNGNTIGGPGGSTGQIVILPV